MNSLKLFPQIDQDIDEHEEMEGQPGFEILPMEDDTMDDDAMDYDVPTPVRRSNRKRQWITPRLCSALDKAKVKRMKLEN